MRVKNKSTILVLMALIFFALSCNEELGPITDTPVDNVLEYTDLDNEFLIAFIKQRFSEKEFAIIARNSYMSEYSKNINPSVNWLDSEFQYDECEIKDMIEAFYMKNSKPTRLTLNSSRKDGYVFDDEKKFEKFLLFGTRSFRRLQEKFPNVKGSVRVSLPVIGKNGLVLIYYEFFNSNGVGRYELYQFKNNQLKYLIGFNTYTAS